MHVPQFVPHADATASVQASAVGSEHWLHTAWSAGWDRQKAIAVSWQPVPGLKTHWSQTSAADAAVDTKRTHQAMVGRAAFRTRDTNTRAPVQTR